MCVEGGGRGDLRGQQRQPDGQVQAERSQPALSDGHDPAGRPAALPCGQCRRELRQHMVGLKPSSGRRRCVTMAADLAAGDATSKFFKCTVIAAEVMDAGGPRGTRRARCRTQCN